MKHRGYVVLDRALTCINGLDNPVCLSHGGLNAIRVETCDGRDNDCNGMVDDGLVMEQPGSSDFLSVGEPCGTGACSSGVVTCSPSEEPVCSTEFWLPRSDVMESTMIATDRWTREFLFSDYRWGNLQCTG